ncbi:hypothetical protein [Dickeya fangzhongdai]|uniref:hypothetical protein n=1 Tax=Dickeya fangzhongdai TaxID=1778540 RepID=UPI0023E3EC5A|nr:hypothetical protein [Dickeya fangzhongdai]WES89067.1 hypothetical protein PQ617_00480 [Dickeya fangzhongdai]
MRLTTPPAGQQTAYRIIIDEVPDYSPAGGKYGGDEGLFNYQRTGCRFRFGRLPFGIHVRQQQHHRRTAHPKPPPYSINLSGTNDLNNWRQMAPVPART